MSFAFCVSRDKDLEDAQAEIQELRKQLSATRPSGAGGLVQSGQGAAQLQGGALEQQVRDLQDERDAFKAAAANLALQCEAAERELKSTRMERDALRSSLTSLSAENEAAEQYMKAVQEGCDALKDAIAQQSMQREAAERQLMAAQEENVSLREEVERLIAAEAKRKNADVSITRKLASIQTQLMNADHSWTPYRIINDVKQQVFSLQSTAVAQFALHMDSAVLLSAWRSWSQFARTSVDRRRLEGQEAKDAPEGLDAVAVSPCKGKLGTETSTGGQDARSVSSIDPSNPIAGA